MAHPFFDALAYPWHLQEAIDYHAAVSAIEVVQRINNFYKTCRTITGANLDLQKAPQDIWQDVLESLTTQGRLKALLDRLEAAGDFRSNTTYQDAARRVREAEDTTRPQIVFDDVFVVNRDGLRQSLALLEARKGLTKVLLVRGEPKSGKSHGRHLFEYIAAQHGAAAVYIYAENSGTVEAVIDQLFSALGAAHRVPPRDTTNEARHAARQMPRKGDTTYNAWYMTVWSHLQSLAKETEQQLWIAIDDLGFDADGVPLMDTEVKSFCDHIVPFMLSPAFRGRFRVMLINYPGTPGRDVPSNWKADYWTEDNPTAGDLARDHVARFLRYWTERRQLQATQEHLEGLAEEILQNAPNEAAGLEGIYIALKKAVAGLGVPTS